MAKIYRTAQGRSLDIERLRLQNELVPAIGNMRVNARGDQLGPGGKVVKNREQMIDEHYQNNISTKTKKNVAEADIIPTKGGKSKRVEKFEPGNILPDPVIVAPAEKKEIPEVDDFVDPEVNSLVQEPEVNSPVQEPEVNLPPVQEPKVDISKPEPKPVASVAAGEKSIKGGLARAVAKTREYEEKKNKPKRI